METAGLIVGVTRGAGEPGEFSEEGLVNVGEGMWCRPDGSLLLVTAADDEAIVEGHEDDELAKLTDVADRWLAHGATVIVGRGLKPRTLLALHNRLAQAPSPQSALRPLALARSRLRGRRRARSSASSRRGPPGRQDPSDSDLAHLEAAA